MYMLGIRNFVFEGTELINHLKKERRPSEGPPLLGAKWE